MELYCTPNSPYARMCRVVAIERGIAGRVTVTMVTLRDPKSALLPHNPTGKVPTLATDAGPVLADSRNICEYLDQIAGGERLMPDPDLVQRELEGLAYNMLDGIAVWVRELRRPEAERSPGVLALERTRALRAFDALEPLVARYFADERLTFGRIAMACTIGFGDVVLPTLDWRSGHPRVAAWYDRFAARASMRATGPEPV